MESEQTVYRDRGPLFLFFLLTALVPRIQDQRAMEYAYDR